MTILKEPKINISVIDRTQVSLIISDNRLYHKILKLHGKSSDQNLKDGEAGFFNIKTVSLVYLLEVLELPIETRNEVQRNFMEWLRLDGFKPGDSLKDKKNDISTLN